MTTRAVTTQPHEYIRHVLGLWQRWAAGANLSGLGYAQVQYAEMVGGGARKYDDVRLMNPDVRLVDELIPLMPERERKVLLMHYRRPGTVPAKAAELGVSRALYGELLRAGQRWLEHELPLARERRDPRPADVPASKTHRVASAVAPLADAK